MNEERAIEDGGTGTRLDGERWLDVASRIGRRLAGAALWDDDACTWHVEALDPKDRRGRTHTVAADGVLYQGSSGIALFLGELAAVSGDGAAAKAARGGIRHALAATAARPPDAFGFHTGRTGVAWVAARLAELLEDPDLARRAGELLQPMAGHEQRDVGLDVIAGAAGAIAPLLDLARRLDQPSLATMAERLGERLLAAARREPAGWSWGIPGAAITRYLAGLGHGACGIGTALLELAAARGRGDFRFAAEMAFLYERRLFEPLRSNWPDLRHSGLNLLYYSGGPQAVRRADEAGAVGPYEPSFMRAWCHGAPGAGLARLRAWELTGQSLYRREAEAALRPTLDSLRPPIEQSFSLCHGAGGNCELPLRAAAAFGDPSLLDACRRTAEHGWDTYEGAGRPWFCGTAGGVLDPSLMLGEAGIGLFYLRLARPDLPSVLLLRPRGWRPLDLAAEDDGYRALSESWLEERFGAARAAFAALGAGVEPGRVAAADAAAGPALRSPLEESYEALRRRVESAADAERRLLADAFRVERRRYELEARPNDLTEEYRRHLRRPAPQAVCWEAVGLAAAPELELVETEHDWPRWLAAPGGAEAPRRPGGTWLLARLGDRVLLRPLGALAAAVLRAVFDAGAAAATLENVVEQVAARLGGDGDLLHERVAAQVAALYRSGLLDVEAPPRQRRAAG